MSEIHPNEVPRAFQDGVEEAGYHVSAGYSDTDFSIVEFGIVVRPAGRHPNQPMPFVEVKRSLEGKWSALGVVQGVEWKRSYPNETDDWEGALEAFLKDCAIIKKETLG